MTGWRRSSATLYAQSKASKHMSDVIRAVYEMGQLRPLEPLSLTDGQEVFLAILSERTRMRAALGGILAPASTEPEDTLDEAAIVAMIDAELRGSVSVSDAILEECRGQ